MRAARQRTGQRAEQRLDLAVDDDGVQALLAAKVFVHDRLRDVGAQRDLLDRRALEALLRKQRFGHADQLLATFAGGHAGARSALCFVGHVPSVPRFLAHWCAGRYFRLPFRPGVMAACRPLEPCGLGSNPGGGTRAGRLAPSALRGPCPQTRGCGERHATSRRHDSRGGRRHPHEVLDTQGAPPHRRALPACTTRSTPRRVLTPSGSCVVVRHERDLVAAHALEAAPDALMADQDDVPGTGRAVWCGLSALDARRRLPRWRQGHERDHALSMQAAGCHRRDLCRRAARRYRTARRACSPTTRQDGRAVTVMTARVDDPTGYGRIVHDAGRCCRPRSSSSADATEAELAITEINTGIYVFDAATLRDALTRLDHGQRPRRVVPHRRGRDRAGRGQAVGAFVAPMRRRSRASTTACSWLRPAPALNRSVLNAGCARA